MPTIGGFNTLDIQTPRLAQVDYAVAGFPFTDATQAGTFGIRKIGKLNLPPISRVDAIGRDQNDAQQVKVEIELWQDNYAAVKRQMLLTQCLQQLRFKIGLDWYNFIDNTANPPFVTPNGSVLLGCETTFECTPTELSLKAEYSGKMHPKEYDWLLSNATASQTGGTGGTTVTGLDSEAYDQDEYGYPGFTKCFIGTGDTSTDDELGLLEAGSKISIKFAKTQETTRMQPIVRMVEVTNEIVMLQSRYYDLQALAAYRNDDFVLTYQLWNGITLVFNHSTSINAETNLDDEKTFIKLRNVGKIPFDTLNAAQSNILFDDTNKKITFNRVGYL